MTVAEVIEALKIAPPDAHVQIYQYSEAKYAPIDRVIVSFVNGQAGVIKIGG